MTDLSHINYVLDLQKKQQDIYKTLSEYKKLGELETRGRAVEFYKLHKELISINSCLYSPFDEAYTLDNKEIINNYIKRVFTDTLCFGYTFIIKNLLTGREYSAATNLLNLMDIYMHYIKDETCTLKLITKLRKYDHKYFTFKITNCLYTCDDICTYNCKYIERVGIDELAIEWPSDE